VLIKKIKIKQIGEKLIIAVSSTDREEIVMRISFGGEKMELCNVEMKKSKLWPVWDCGSGCGSKCFSFRNVSK
jgi:hypothetical protein